MMALMGYYSVRREHAYESDRLPYGNVSPTSAASKFPL